MRCTRLEITVPYDLELRSGRIVIEPNSEGARPRQIKRGDHHRGPGRFSDSPPEDIHDWIKHYYRENTAINWDDTIRLANVVFHLRLSAQVSFDNHEEELLDWHTFCLKTREMFRSSDVRSHAVKSKLETRAQLRD